MAPVASMASSTESYWAVKAGSGVISAGLPGLALLVNDPSTSLLPIHTLTSVGSASAMRSSWVRPPRKNVVRALEDDTGVPKLDSNSCTRAPGTARLLMVPVVGIRRSQVVPVPPPTRAWVTLLVNGGAQPRPLSLG